jgi:hypothetical protein
VRILQAASIQIERGQIHRFPDSPIPRFPDSPIPRFPSLRGLGKAPRRVVTTETLATRLRNLISDPLSGAPYFQQLGNLGIQIPLPIPDPGRTRFLGDPHVSAPDPYFKWDFLGDQGCGRLDSQTF